MQEQLKNSNIFWKNRIRENQGGKRPFEASYRSNFLQYMYLRHIYNLTEYLFFSYIFQDKTAILNIMLKSHKSLHKS